MRPCASGNTLLAFGGIALRGYRLDGALRFELLRRRDTAYVQTAGRWAYFGTDNSTRFIVVDVRAGRVVGTTRNPHLDDRPRFLGLPPPQLATEEVGAGPEHEQSDDDPAPVDDLLVTPRRLDELRRSHLAAEPAEPGAALAIEEDPARDVAFEREAECLPADSAADGDAPAEIALHDLVDDEDVVDPIAPARDRGRPLEPADEGRVRRIELHPSRRRCASGPERRAHEHEGYCTGC